MAKNIFKKSFSVLLAMIICVGFMSITAFAEETNPYAGSHLLGAAENDLATFNFVVLPEYAPEAGDERYAVVGHGEQTEFWTAFLYTTPAKADEVPVVEIDGVPYYNRGDGRNIKGIYLNGEHLFADTTFSAAYNGLEQAILMNGNGKQVTVYCVDHVVSATTAARYTVANIEDATHYDKTTAGKIRAVAANGYWGGIEEVDENGSIAKMQAMMKKAVDAAGERVFTDEEIELLTPGVALSATQFALWELANANDDRQVVNVQYIVKNRVAGYNGKSWNTLKTTPAAEVPCVDLIFKLSNYLANLAPVSPVEMTTGNTVLTDKVILQEMNIDVLEKAAGHPNNEDDDKTNDAYVTNVTFDMLPVSKKDSLTAKIVDAEGNVYAIGRIVGQLQDGEVQLIENANGTYTFPGVTLIENTETTYSVVVEGVQHLERNVYLYTAGDREVSQTLIGYNEGEFTTYVESSIKKTFNVDDPTVVINKVDEKGNALGGAKFALYAITENGEVQVGNGPKKELTSDPKGKITINNLAPGSYKLVEIEAPAGYIGVTESMYFTVVGLNDGQNFVVHEEYEVEYPGTSYEISNHSFNPAIPQNFVLLDAGMADKWTYTEEYVFGESDFNVVYCGDDKTDLVDDTRYVKKALEECFDAETAAKLRAIVANSYPYVSMEEMIAAATAAGVADAENLTRGDIIAAVQLAIWKYTNDEAEDYFSYKFTYSVKNFPSWGGVFHDYSEEAAAQGLPVNTTKRYYTEYKDTALPRIEALYAYLLGLEGLADAKCEVSVNFYVPVGGKDVSQSLIGAGIRSNFYTNGLNIYVKNYDEAPDVVINKIDEKGNALAGAKFALYAITENGEVQVGKEHAVDPKGKLTIKDLAPGTYKLVETKAPDGYIAVSDPMYFEVVKVDGDFQIRQVYEVEYDNSYEISNHTFYPAIPQTFVLLNGEDADAWTYSEEYAFGESDFNVVYCGDSETGLVDETRYVKKDLEDCFDAETAAKLRAIVANSYPYVSKEEMIAAAVAAGVADAANLTRGDIIAAVQMAIWNKTNGVGYTYRGVTYSVPDYPQWGGIYHDYSDELHDYLKELTGTTKRIKDEAGSARIDALYAYLIGLDGLTAAECDIDVYYYVALDGKEASQSLIGAERSSFYTNGLSIYVKNAKAPEPPAPPTITFKSGEASNISFMLLDTATGKVEFLKKIDIGGQTSFDIPYEAGKVSVVFVKQSTSGMFWFSEEVSEEMQNAAIKCLKANNPSYKGHNAIAFGEGNHKLEFKKNKFVTYTFDMGTVDVEAKKPVAEAPKVEEPKVEAPAPAPAPEAPEAPKVEEPAKPATLDVTVKGAKVKSWTVKDGVTAIYIAADGKIPAVVWTSEEVDAKTMAEIIDELGASKDAKTVFGFGPHKIEYQQNKNKTKSVTYTFQ